MPNWSAPDICHLTSRPTINKPITKPTQTSLRKRRSSRHTLGANRAGQTPKKMTNEYKSCSVRFRPDAAIITIQMR